MELADYRALVASLEAVAAREPEALRRRVQSLIALGYGYVLLVLLGLVGATAGIVVYIVSTGRGGALAKLVFALLVATGIVVRALWVRVSPPAGRVLRPDEAPALFERVEAIRAALDAPAPDAILLDDAFNASVSSVPRLGIFGWPRTYLTVGVPLLYALTPAQFDAVLAHEFGHLSGAHPKHGLWVHRVGRTWQRLIDDMERRESAALWLFAWFFRWFVPRLNAYGYVMSRADEYAADADAARVTSASAIGGALVALEVRGQVLHEDFWRGIWARARHEPEPPAEAWRQFPSGVRQHDTPEVRPARLAAALTADVGDADTHPPLRERLRALGLVVPDAADAPQAAAALLSPLDDTAAAHYLGSVAERELSAMDAKWTAAAAEDWRETFAAAEARRRRITAFEAKDAATGLDTEDLLAWLSDVREDAGDEAAMPIARRLLAKDPESAEAHYALGKALVKRDEAEGVALLRRAMVLEPEAVMPGAQLLFAYYERSGDSSGMAEMEAMFDARRDQLRAAAAERDGVKDGDTFALPTLDPEIARVLRQAIGRTPGVARVLVTRKVTVHEPDRPLYILIPQMSWRESYRFRRSRNVPRELLDAAPALPHVDLICVSEDPSRHRALVRRLKKARSFVTLLPDAA